MKKIKGIIFAAGFVLCGFIAGSCVNTVEAGQKDPFEFKPVDNDKVGIYNVCEMIVCTLYEDYFACMDKREKKRYLFNYSDIDKILFANRLEALTLVTDAEKDKPKVSNERFYEED